MVLFLSFFLSSCNKSIDSGTLYKQSIESIVELKAFNNSEDISPSFGTAVFLEKDILVTNFHILSYTYLNDLRVFENISIRFYDQSDFVEVELFEYDELLDIAFLRIESFFGTPIKVGDSLEVDFGDTVYAIGNGNNTGISITKGIISIPKVYITIDNYKRLVIQSDLTIVSGNSGGALINQMGELIGITSFRLKDNNNTIVYGIAYSIPINIIIEKIRS